MQEKGEQKRLDVVDNAVRELGEGVSAAQAAAAESILAWGAAKARLEKLETEVRGSSLICSPYQVAHRAVIFGHKFIPQAWRTKCGYEYGLSSYQEVEQLPTSSKNIGGTCFPLEKEEARASELAQIESADLAEVSSDDE